MRKHFLLLLLTALLPLASWAQTVSFGEVGIGKFTYGDATAPEPVIKDSKGAILVKGTHYTVAAGDHTGIFSDEACTTEVASFTALKAGTTKYYRKVEGIGAYDGQVAHPYFNVEKADLTLTLNANALDRDYGTNQVAINANGSQFTATAGLKYTDTWPTIKKGNAPTYSTTGNVKGTYSTADATNKLTFTGGWEPDNYNITYVGELAIAARNISATATITAYQGNVVYTGKTITPVYTVKDKAEGGVVLTAGTAPVLYADVAEYNAAKGTTLDAGAFDALTDAEKTKTPGTGDYYVTTAKNVGAYTPIITFQGNYSGSITVADAKKFNVTPAPIIVSVKDIEKVYNGADQANQTGSAVYSYAGIVGDDIANAATIKGNFTSPSALAVDGEAINKGEYDLVIEDDATTGTETNYEISGYVPGKLTITAAPLAIKAKDANKGIGDADPEFKLIDYAPLKISGVTFTRESGEEAGDKKITPVIDKIVVKDAGDNVVTSNYNITVDENKGKLTIGKGKIYVTIKDAEKFYGQKDPEFTYTATGLIGSDKVVVPITREEGETVKGYSMTATVANPDPAKYSEVVVAPGIFTIKKAQLTFTIPAQNVEIGVDKSKLSKKTITVAGINNTDKDADLYDLSFGAAVHTTAGKTTDNETVLAGIVATLKDAAKANYEVIGDNKADLDTDGKYESATGKLIVGTGTAVAIAFTTAANDADYNLIKAHAGETQDVTVTLNRRNARVIPAGTAHPWKKETWNTMVLPFEVTVAELSTQLGYAIVNVVDKDATTEGNVQFMLEMQKIPANTPFCVKTSSDIPNGKVLTFEDKLIVDGGENPSVDAGMGYKFVGAYKDKTINKTTPTYNFLRGDNNKWAHIGATSGNSWTVVPFDAYVELTEAAAARGVTFTFEEIDGTATVIKAVDAEVTEIAESAKSAAEGWYTINGIKLNAKPTQKGIYIFNGKKVAIQ